MSDPFNPIPEVRKHQANYIVDEHGDTWDETGTVKIAFTNPTELLAAQDATRVMIRKALDEVHGRDTVPVHDRDGNFIGNMLVGDAIRTLQIGDMPTEENLMRAVARGHLTEHNRMRRTISAYRRTDDLDTKFPEIVVTAKTLCVRGDSLGRDNLVYLMNKMYREGGNAEIVYVSLETALEARLIGRWEYTWRRVARELRGIWARSANFGARFARRTRGTTKTTPKK